MVWRIVAIDIMFRVFIGERQLILHPSFWLQLSKFMAFPSTIAILSDDVLLAEAYVNAMPWLWPDLGQYRAVGPVTEARALEGMNQGRFPDLETSHHAPQENTSMRN